MTTTRTLLSIAIIAALPFCANADYTYNYVNTPARVAYGGTITSADTTGPYVTADIGNADSEHIASTAYVKGAYNDVIGAVNTVTAALTDELSYKSSLYLGDNDEEPGMSNRVVPDINYVYEDNELVSGMAVKNAITGVNNTIAAKRVTIYTTWDDDSANATTQVTLSIAQ